MIAIMWRPRAWACENWSASGSLDRLALRAFTTLHSIEYSRIIKYWCYAIAYKIYNTLLPCADWFMFYWASVNDIELNKLYKLLIDLVCINSNRDVDGRNSVMFQAVRCRWLTSSSINQQINAEKLRKCCLQISRICSSLVITEQKTEVFKSDLNLCLAHRLCGKICQNRTANIVQPNFQLPQTSQYVRLSLMFALDLKEYLKIRGKWKLDFSGKCSWNFSITKELFSESEVERESMRQVCTPQEDKYFIYSSSSIFDLFEFTKKSQSHSR